MCGIAGIYNFQKAQPVEQDLIQRMVAKMKHRGPDDEGFYLKRSMGMGMARLSIIDVEGGHQPIPNEDQTIWTVFNGEIYNFHDLRQRLLSKGHIFHTRSDTETIVHAYEEWGDDCLLHLNGIYGLAIWDNARKRLLLARDPFGVKPLYYYNDGKRILWGSEIKAILADNNIPREVDKGSLDLFLTFRFVPSPFTLFQGIRKIQPGHRLIVENGHLLQERCFFFNPNSYQHLREDEYILLLQERFEAAVRRQMISDVPIGLLLSGGIDSAVILAIMSEAASEPVHTFTVGFSDGGDANELYDANLTAKHFGAKHHEILLNNLDYRKLIEKSIWHIEEPIGTTSALPMYFVSQLARKHVKVVLTGQGADEPLCGYHRYFGERYGHWYRRVPKKVREHIMRPFFEALPRNERFKRAVRSLGTSDITERFIQIYSVFNQEMREALWQPDQYQPALNNTSRETINYWRKGIEDLDPLIQMASVDARLSLSDDLLMYGDKMSMAASVEARVPFLDLDYMAVAESLPSHLRIRALVRKYIHKKAIAKWLPQHVINRKKRGFETPVDRWFRSDMTTYVRQSLVCKDSACSTYFRTDTISDLIDEHVTGREDNHRQIFCLLVFELWHRLFISNKI